MLTDPKALTGELTPPGIEFLALSNNSEFIDIAVYPLISVRL